MAIMKQGALAESSAIRKMKKDTDELANNLFESSKKLTQRTENLNSDGFQDSHFEKLNVAIQDSKDNMEKLKKVVISFSDFLEKLAKRIDDYTGGETISNKNNIDL